MVRSIRRRRSKPPEINWEIGVYPASDRPGENALIVIFTANASVLAAEICGPGEVPTLVERTARKLTLRTRPSKVRSNAMEALMFFDPPLDDESGEFMEALPNTDKLLEETRQALASKKPPYFWMPVAAWEQELTDVIYDLTLSRVGLTFGAKDVIRFACDERELAFVGAVCVGENMPVLAFATNEDDLLALTGWSDPGTSPPVPTITLEGVPAFGLDEVALAQAYAANIDPEIGAVPYVLHYPTANEAPSTGVVPAALAYDLLLCAQALAGLLALEPNALRERNAEFVDRDNDETIRVTIARHEETELPAVPEWLQAWHEGVEESDEELTPQFQCRVEDGVGQWRTFNLDSGASLEDAAMACGAAMSLLPDEDDDLAPPLFITLSTAAGGLLAGFVEHVKESQVFMSIPASEYPLFALLHLVGDGVVVELGDDISGLLLTIEGIVYGDPNTMTELTGGSDEADLDAEREAFDMRFELEDPYEGSFDDEGRDDLR